jgi:hypothetical protein
MARASGWALEAPPIGVCASAHIVTASATTITPIAALRMNLDMVASSSR